MLILSSIFFIVFDDFLYCLFLLFRPNSVSTLTVCSLTFQKNDYLVEKDVGFASFNSFW